MSIEERDFWPPLDRRRLLRGIAVGAGGLAAAALIGCGDDADDDDDAGEATPSASPEAMAIPDGGTLRVAQSSEPSGLDQATTINITTQFVADGVYSRLVRFKEGPLPDVQALELAPDLATEWEFTPDFSEYRFKLREGVTFHDRPPVNGRELLAEDVAASIERINTQPGVYKSYLRDVAEVQTPDSGTVVFKLSRPNSVFANTLANFGVLRVMPREANIDYDPKVEMIGSGPWQFESYESARQLTFTRFERHWTPPHFEQLTIPIISGLANQIARLTTGEIDLVQRVALPQDAALARSSELQETIPYYGNTTRIIVFAGQRPESEAYVEDSPLLDDRVRRALSMGMNRRATSEALSVDAPAFVLDNYVPAGLRTWWLDPLGSEISPEAAAIFQHNPAEAAKLLASAGYGDGFATTLHYSAVYPESYTSRAEAYASQWGDLGLQVSLDPQEYNTFLGTTFAGKSPGIGFILKSYFSGIEAMDSGLHSKATSNYGAVNDAELDQLIDDAYGVPIEESIELIARAQDLADRRAYYAPTEPDVNLDFAVPSLGGFLEHYGGTAALLSEAAPFFYRKEV